MKSYDVQSIFIILLCISLTNSQDIYTLVKHNYDRGAACLDGSQAGLYYHIGSETNKDKFLIYFNSGGYCGAGSLSDTIQSCYKRSFGSLGSTANIPSTRSFDGQGILSTLESDNPLFYDWTKIYAIYCDGSQHQGSVLTPIPYKDRTLYFRGTNNTLQHFHYLDKTFNFYTKSTIVITGVSAGGMATYLFSNYLIDHTITAKVYAIPDSGLFITDYYSPIVQEQALRHNAEALFRLVNADNFMFEDCVQQFDGDIIQCFNTANLAKYLKAPMLILESLYDEYSLDEIVVAECLSNSERPYSIVNCNATTRAAIEEYRDLMRIALEKFKQSMKRVSIWAVACVKHGFTDENTFTDLRYRAGVNRKSLVQAIQQFLADPNANQYNIDEQPWPNNYDCSGLNTD